MVLSDNGVPECFPGARQAHSKWEERESDGVRGVSAKDSFIAADACIVIHIPRFSHPNHRVQKKIGSNLPCSPKREFLMGSV
jgi:hypothetical protein